MSRSDPTPDRLADLLNDERARRAWAEQQLVSEKEKTRTWRNRAEERAAEIRRLKWRRSGGKGAPPSKTPSPSSSVHDEVRDKPNPLYAAVLAGECDAPPWLAEAFDTVPLDRPGVRLEDLDLVVAGSDRALNYLGEWLRWEGRRPLILTDGISPEAWTESVRPGDIAVGRSVGAATVLDARPIVMASRVDPPAESWTDLDEATSVEDAVHLAAYGAPLAARPGFVEPPGLEGLVRAHSDDPRKQGILGRLVARRRYGLAAFVAELASVAGLSLPHAIPNVGVLLVTNRPERLAEALTGIARLHYPRVEVVVGMHGPGFEASPALVESWSATSGLSATVLAFPDEATLGECLNRCAEATSAPILAKIDDDDIYGPWYLDEAVDVVASTGADLVGKATFAMILEGSDDLVLQAMGKENSEVAYVPGASFVMPRHTWEQIPFAHRRSRVDSTFVRGLRSRGMTVWASSRYEFVVRRSPSGHTWETSERLLRAQGERIGQGSDWSGLMLDGQEA